MERLRRWGIWGRLWRAGRLFPRPPPPLQGELLTTYREQRCERREAVDGFLAPTGYISICPPDQQLESNSQRSQMELMGVFLTPLLGPRASGRSALTGSRGLRLPCTRCDPVIKSDHLQRRKQRRKKSEGQKRNECIRMDDDYCFANSTGASMGLPDLPDPATCPR